MLSSLPPEILHNVVFFVCAHKPLGPPSALLDLRLVSQHLNATLGPDKRPVPKHQNTNLGPNDLLARIFSHKFDHRAIARRLFKPTTADCADQLFVYCRLLRAIRTAVRLPDCAYLEAVEGDGDDTPDLLQVAYFMLLENDGKNYAQLEHAGLYTFVDRFIRKRLFEGRGTNGGWPLNSMVNGFALSIMWMMTSSAKLSAETRPQRDEIVLNVIPYVFCTQRYPAAEAPPNHYDLPLLPNNPAQPQYSIALSTAASPHAPKYPHYLNHGGYIAYHWRSRMEISPPLCTIAAKLLFAARKDLTPFAIPAAFPVAPGPGIPFGFTQQDYRELNRKTAKLVPVVGWDWDSGCPRPVDPSSLSGCEGDWEDSKRWDTEWWRRVLCIDYRVAKPRFVPGQVFKPGSMHGMWQGRAYQPQGTLYSNMLENPIYPSVPDPTHPHLFTEQSLGMGIQPIFLRIKEHHRICGCATVEGQHEAHCEEGQGCGIIPIPPLVIHERPVLSQRAADEQAGTFADNDVTEAAPVLLNTPERPEDEPANDRNAIDMSSLHREHVDYGMTNSWFPGRLGGVTFVKKTSSRRQLLRDEVVFGLDSQRPSYSDKAPCAVFESDQGNPGNDEHSRASFPTASRSQPVKRFPVPPPPNTGPFVYETYDPKKLSAHDIHKAKCMTCKEREQCINEQKRKLEIQGRMALDEALLAFGQGNGKSRDLVDLDTDASGFAPWAEMIERNMMEDIDMEAPIAGPSSPHSSSPKGKGKRAFDDTEMDQSPSSSSSTTTDAPASPSASKRRQSRSPSVSSEMSVDDFDPSRSSSTHQHDLSEGASSSASLLRSAPVSPSASASTPHHATQMLIFGDDAPEGHEPVYHPDDAFKRVADGTRPTYDRVRVGMECNGVRDIVVTGATEGRHVLWGAAAVYGRVRPWDGLVGMLRMVQILDKTNYFFIFGYVVADQTFVGEWRFAATQPWRPTWSGAFVMSRCPEEPESASS